VVPFLEVDGNKMRLRDICQVLTAQPLCHILHKNYLDKFSRLCQDMVLIGCTFAVLQICLPFLLMHQRYQDSFKGFY